MVTGWVRPWVLLAGVSVVTYGSIGHRREKSDFYGHLVVTYLLSTVD